MAIYNMHAIAYFRMMESRILCLYSAAYPKSINILFPATPALNILPSVTLIITLYSPCRYPAAKL